MNFYSHECCFCRVRIDFKITVRFAVFGGCFECDISVLVLLQVTGHIPNFASSHKSFRVVCQSSVCVTETLALNLTLTRGRLSVNRPSVCRPSVRQPLVCPAARPSVCPTVCPSTVRPSVLEFSSVCLSTLTLLRGTLPLPYHACACSLCAAAPVPTAG